MNQAELLVDPSLNPSNLVEYFTSSQRRPMVLNFTVSVISPEFNPI